MHPEFSIKIPLRHQSCLCFDLLGQKGSLQPCMHAFYSFAFACKRSASNDKGDNTMLQWMEGIGEIVIVNSFPTNCGRCHDSDIYGQVGWRRRRLFVGKIYCHDMTLSCGDHRKPLHLRDRPKHPLWKDGTAMLQDALADGPCVPFARMCLQLHVACSTQHSLKELKWDMKYGTRSRPAVFAKQLLNVWTSMHT